jgi:hypothetical protein
MDAAPCGRSSEGRRAQGQVHQHPHTCRGCCAWMLLYLAPLCTLTSIKRGHAVHVVRVVHCLCMRTHSCCSLSRFMPLSRGGTPSHSFFRSSSLKSTRSCGARPAGALNSPRAAIRRLLMLPQGGEDAPSPRARVHPTSVVWGPTGGVADVSPSWVGAERSEGAAKALSKAPTAVNPLLHGHGQSMSCAGS